MFVLLLLITSVAAGMLLRCRHRARFLERSSTFTVWLLIFVFGISLGSNDAITSDFTRFGFTALVVALAGVAGSVAAACVLARYIDRHREEE